MLLVSFQGHGRVGGTVLFTGDLRLLPSGPVPWAISSSVKLAKEGRVPHGCCTDEERKCKPCIHEADMIASRDAPVTDTCLHVEGTKPMRGGRAGTGLASHRLPPVLHCFLPTFLCRPHCSSPSAREGRTTVDAGEPDAAPGGLCTEVTPLRSTGESSCGQQ